MAHHWDICQECWLSINNCDCYKKETAMPETGIQGLNEKQHNRMREILATASLFETELNEMGNTVLSDPGKDMYLAMHFFNARDLMKDCKFQLGMAGKKLKRIKEQHT